MIKEMSKTKKISFIYFIVILLLTLLRIFIYAVPLKISDNAIDWIFTLIAQILVMGIVPLFLYIILILNKSELRESLRCIKEDWQYNIKLSPVIWILTLVVAILMYYSNMGVSILSNAIIAAFGFTHIIPPPTMYYTISDLLLGIFMTAVLPGTFEELTHRGLILSGFKQYGDKYAVLISATLFALMHQNIVQVFYAFYAGLILGTLTVKTKSIFPAMFVHFFNNAMSVIEAYSEQHNGTLASWFNVYYDYLKSNFGIILLSWAVSVIALFALLKVIGFMRDKEEIKEVFGDEADFKMVNNVSSSKFLKPYDIQKDYFLITTLTLASLTTVISFYWGLIR
jgi:membrane protease YdiL (CAAX protease family)